MVGGAGMGSGQQAEQKKSPCPLGEKEVASSRVNVYAGLSWGSPSPPTPAKALFSSFQCYFWDG